jgi:hypothetical protein
MGDGGSKEAVLSRQEELAQIVEAALRLADELELHMTAIHLQSALDELSKSIGRARSN